MQPLWEMKALSDPVDLGLLDKARANKEYKADFADLSMESIHVCPSFRLALHDLMLKQQSDQHLTFPAANALPCGILHGQG